MYIKLGRHFLPHNRCGAISKKYKYECKNGKRTKVHYFVVRVYPETFYESDDFETEEERDSALMEFINGLNQIKLNSALTKVEEKLKREGFEI